MDAAAWVWPTDEDRQRWIKEGRNQPRWTLWESRYEQFRLAGPHRSLLGVYNRERAAKKQPQPPALSVPGAWDQMAKWGGWRERAAKWDVEELLKARHEREAEEQQLRSQARAQRRRLVDASYALVVEVLTAVDKDDKGITVKTAAQMLGAISRHLDNSRKEYGDPNDLNAVTAALQQAGAVPRDRMLNEVLQVRAEAFKSNDLGLVIKTLEMERDLRGLGKSTLQITGEDGGPIQSSSVVLYLPDNGRQPDPGAQSSGEPDVSETD